MSLRQQEPGFGQLSPIESVDDYCFGNRRISHDENNDFNGKMGVDDFRSECGDDDVTATNVNQMEMHRLPFFSVDQILERQASTMSNDTMEVRILLHHCWRKSLSQRATVDEINEVEGEGITNKSLELGGAMAESRRNDGLYFEEHGDPSRNFDKDGIEDETTLKLINDFVASTICEVVYYTDSLARVATLQECDRNRDPNGILDFLETTMNIEDYLDDIHAVILPHLAAEIPLDSIDHEDIALQKCKTACQGDQLSKYHANDSFSHNSHYDDIQGYLFSTALTLSTPDLKSALPKIKDEPYWEGNPSTSSTLSQKKQRRNVQAPEAYSPSSYTPATTPRKYRLKTPQERNNTLYKVKRQRNNDAVRKSRSKAKQLQMMKEKQLEEALLENKELKEKLRIVNERLSSCRCQN